MISDQY